MISALQTFPAQAQDIGEGNAPPAETSGVAPAGWQELRASDDIQFAPVEIPELPPREPSWLERALESVFDLLGRVIEPIAQFVFQFWWIFAALVAVFVLFLLVRLYGPVAREKRMAEGRAAADAPGWTPDRSESLALLEDADRLAAEGRFDEATHLLLKRSVGQIAAARPGLVEPSSTARELAVLPALPDTARTAFAVVAERVERSLFALGSLDRADWEVARTAYAEFALQQIGTG